MIYKYSPYFIFKRLWGDRRQYGLVRDVKDIDFVKWLSVCHKFYSETQKGTLGVWVNHLGYKVTSSIDFKGKTIAELGPGVIEHTQYHLSKPVKYMLVDIDSVFLEKSKKILVEQGYGDVETVASDGNTINIDDSSLDIILTFNQLEHVTDLDNYVQEIKRVLKPGGLLVGAVPCEGGVAWGLGRFLTTRRYCKVNFDFNFDKVICWEHPNFVDHIKSVLGAHFKVVEKNYRPFAIPLMDINLVFSFVYENKK